MLKRSDLNRAPSPARSAITMTVASVALALATFVAAGLARAQSFELGVHYVELDEPQATQTGDRFEVREMFWYKCPHCFNLEPYLNDWLKNKPESAEFVRMPATLNESWVFEARVYYTFEALGMVEELHGPYFDVLHRQRRNIRDAEALADWAAEQGVDRDKVLEAFDSFAVDTKLRHARLMTDRYGINGVPSIILDGRFRTSVSMAGGHDELIALINFVASQEPE